MSLTFLACELFSHKPIGVLDPKSFAFNDPVWGSGSLEMKLTISKNTKNIKNITRPDMVELFVSDDNQFVWSGIINYRLPSMKKKELLVKAQDWRAYYYDRYYTNRKFYDSIDRYQMVYQIFADVASGLGAPPVILPTALAGDNHQYTIEPWWSAGKALDSFGNRENGFEWSISARYGMGGAFPELFLEVWDEGQERNRRPLLFLDVSEDSNKINVGDMPEDATTKTNRFFAIGEGDPEPFVPDFDPVILTNTVLIREGHKTFSGVVETDTLFAKARAERALSNAPHTQIPIDHAPGHPAIKAYRPGDRARLRINDGWTNMDQRGIRIIDRAISKREGSPVIVTAILDLADIKDVS